MKPGEQDWSGEWKIRYVKHKWGATSNGAEQIGVLVSVEEGPAQGRRFVWYGSWTEAALPITFDGLVALGWAGKSLGTITEDVKPGAEAMGVFAYETYEGKQRLRLNFINPMRTIRFAKPLEEAARKVLAQRVHTLIDRGAHVRRDASARGSRDEDDDIPF